MNLGSSSSPETKAFFRRAEGGWWIGYGPFEARPEPPQDGGPAFYLNDFGLSDPAPWKVPSRLEASTHLAFADGREPPRVAWSAPDGEAFAVVFQEVMETIRRGTFEKTVPVVVETGQLEGGDPQALAQALETLPPALTGYGWIEEDRGFLGATPELFFQSQKGRLQTMALAGTARREEREVFAIDEKEIREHEYVAQTLLAKLADIGMVRRRDRRILDLGPIVHFLTPIEVELYRGESIDGLIRRLHPTPALGPLPRTAETLEMLLNWRKRLACPAFFGAPFGLYVDRAFHSVVAIRGMAWEGERVNLPAGCGVIEASRLVNEWRELQLKRESVKALLFPKRRRSQ